MATLSVRPDLYVLKLKAYKIILKVRKFQLPTYYRFSTAEGEISLWVDSSPPGGLNRVNFNVRSGFRLSEADTKSKNFVNIFSSRFFELILIFIICRNLSVDSFETLAFLCLDFFCGFLTSEMFALIFRLFLTFSFTVELSS